MEHSLFAYLLSYPLMSVMLRREDIPSPYTGDIDYGIYTALILIALFVMYITIKNKRRGR